MIEEELRKIQAKSRIKAQRDASLFYISPGKDQTILLHKAGRYAPGSNDPIFK